MAYVEVTTENGRPVEALAKLIEKRGKWLKETAMQSCTAVMIDVLVSLRAATKTARPTQEEIKLELTYLEPSFTGPKNAKKFCLRIGRARYVLKSNEHIRHATYVWNKDTFVWKWNRFGKTIYYIVANDESEAMKWALNATKRFAKQRKGLAKHALGVLMTKSGSKTSTPSPNQDVASLASKLGTVRKTESGDKASIQAEDALSYAQLTLKGGKQDIDNALMKAANKVTSVINRKCKDLLLFDNLETPFPEISKRK